MMGKKKTAKMRGGGKLHLQNGGNTSRMNKLEELGRVDAEKAYTSKGKKNLKDEKKRIVGSLKRRGGGVARRGMGKAK
jgi:hypothetical protein|tara:strand:- start:1025 stop:1258 length:234 start_codon:yes stop_codon:yes gene_type:complete